MFRISKTFSFSASHILEGLPPEHPCGRLHGHNYSVTFILQGKTLNSVGFLRDYRELTQCKEWLDKAFDHQHLNDMIRFNPTAELLAKYIFEIWKPTIFELVAVSVQETEKTTATYEP